MSPPLSPSMKLQLARTRRQVTADVLDRARAEAASPQRLEQLERELARLDADIVDLEAGEVDESLPYRADTDG